MAVAILITEASQPERLLPWAKRLAQTRDKALIAIFPRPTTDVGQCKPISAAQKDSTAHSSLVRVATELRLRIDDSDKDAAENIDAVGLSVLELSGNDLGRTLADRVNELGITLLIIPAANITRGNKVEQEWQHKLYRDAPCETMYLRDDAHQRFDGLRVLVTVAGEDDDPVALTIAHSLTSQANGELTASYVGPDVDEVSNEVGRRILERKIAAAIGGDSAQVKRRIVLADTIVDAIRTLDVASFDLILFGGRKPRDIRRLLEGSLFAGATPETVPAVGAVRSALPLSNRLMRRFRSAIERNVPQLDREARISLVERIQSNSAWNFDFVALLALSTLIAGLGLIRNSASVVIGAMLVAPLMTPIVGSGLGLAQGNIRLIRDAVRTFVRGFATAFLIGVVLGVTACSEPTPEMISRGAPTFLDLIVALVSGIAAAYAMGRPNLLSALPGVAIAAALVPPLATSGMSASRFEWPLAWGSLLLFLTNIVAIILGTTTTFWMVGIRPEKRDKPTPNWPLAALLVLVALTIGLTALMSL
jgi:uncharacterized hydrophobic protein (TIGR00271 family)